MNKQNKPKLYLALWKLSKYLYHIHHQMKKEYKYSLGQSILDLSWETLDKVILANKLPNKKKPETIKEASASFERLKIRLRMAHELNLISHKQYAHIIRKEDEIERMLAGWLRWAEKK